jgi:iron complex outermembrane receptor protein
MNSIFIKRISIFILFLGSSFVTFSQTNTLKGVVKDMDGNPIFNVSVILEGKGKGALTDDGGNFEIQNIPSSDSAVIVLFRFIGYTTISERIVFKNNQTVRKNIILSKEILQLEEAVAIGYGTTRTKDLTGAATVITEKNFSQGSLSSPEQLIQGKVAGVKINTNDGAPGSGSTIRLRGGTSINASNDPLIVLDGVPLDNGGIYGSVNPLALINPNDIASFVILKDASAAAIYGSRGANGVIIITTKKGDASGANKLHVTLDLKNSLATVAKYSEVLSADKYRTLVNEKGSLEQIALLGNENTDWQKVVFRNAFINENNVSVTGGIKKLPYRLSFGNRLENGLLLRDRLNRTTLSLNMNPSFFNKALEFEINQKLVQTNSLVGDRGAAGASVYYDPTKPVFSGNDAYGGYNEWLTNSGKPNGPLNPLGMLMQREEKSLINRYIGNAKATLILPFMPKFKTILNVGTDQAEGTGIAKVNDLSAGGYPFGSFGEYRNTKGNKLIEAYVNFNSRKKKNIENEVQNHVFDVTLGYSYQDWYTSSPNVPTFNYANDTIITLAQPFPFYTKNALLSYYTRGIYSFKEKFIFTGTLRRDGSSRFSPETRWGLFPSLSAAYILTDEKFLKNSKNISFLKVRAGFGVTGQQDGIGDYSYIPNYTISNFTAQYAFGGVYYQLFRPDGYDRNLKWEETRSYNLGIDFGFWKDRVNGSIDFYRKETFDLLATVPTVAGTNFTNEILTNVGAMLNQGVEFSMNSGLVAKKNFKMDMGFNITYNKNEVTKLSVVVDESSPGIQIGGLSAGIGNTIQIHQLGYPTFNFYTYEQKYDSEGKLIVIGNDKPNGGKYTDLDAFVDRNGDNIINENDLYYGAQMNPKFYLGSYLNFVYKKWTAGFSFRSELGGSIYNNVHAGAAFNEIDGLKGYLNNISELYFVDEVTQMNPKMFLSDHWIEKANFLRMDYINIGYNFGKLKFVKEKVGLQATFVVTNVFVITNYSGIDPEVNGGIDNSMYPRPRTYSLNLTFNF